MRKGRWTYTIAGLTLVAACGWALVLAARPETASTPPAPPDRPAVVLAAAPPAPSAGRTPRVWTVRGDGDAGGIRVLSLGGSAWLGVRIEEVDADAASDLKLPRAYGARVTEVIEDGPAAKAGVKKDDVIVQFDGQPVPGTKALRRMVSETPEGRTVSMRLIRDGRDMKVDVEIDERESEGNRFSFRGLGGPDSEFEIPDVEIPDVEILGHGSGTPLIRRFEFLGGPRLGVSVQSVTGQLAEHFGVRSGEGVLVTEVHEDTPAERAGFQAGDVITEVAGSKIDDVGDLHDALRKHEGERVSITVVRDRSERSLDVTLDKPERRGHGDWTDDEGRELDSRLRQLDKERQSRSQEAMKLRQEALRARAEARRSRSEVLREELESRREAMREGAEQRREQLNQLQDRLRELQERLRTMSAPEGVVQI